MARQLHRLSQFYEVLNKVCDVLEFGEEKYKNDDNWRSIPVKKHLDSAIGHLLQCPGPDQETGADHIIHALCRALFAAQNMENDKNA